jgi:hypothetical protein
MSGDFGAAVRRLQASMGGDDIWHLPEPPAAEGPSPELRAQRREGRRAYQRAMEMRGIPRHQARIWAFASFIWDDED